MTYPKIAGINIGGAMDFESPTYQAALAKLSLFVPGYYPGLAPGGVPFDACMKAIKALNPAVRIFPYVSCDGLKVPAQKPYASLVAKIQAMGWWLQDPKGAPVPSFYPGETTVNNTPNTMPDELGYTAIDWITRWWACNANVPSADGLYMDNVLAEPRVTGCWQEGTVSLQPSDPLAVSALQAGYARWFSLIRQLMPGKLQIGNIQSWTANGTNVPAAYVNMTDGGVLEKLIGVPHQSVEDFGGWLKMMTQYWKTMDVVNDPKLVIFGQYRMTAATTDLYQEMRYGLTSCLMHNGYYSFSTEAQGYYGVNWFDEYDAKLGEPTWKPPTQAWSQGVWRRDFDNGIALVNPKGNKPQTIQLEAPYVKIKGTQCPAVNDGSTVTSVTLQDRDGLILKRAA